MVDTTNGAHGPRAESAQTWFESEGRTVSLDFDDRVTSGSRRLFAAVAAALLGRAPQRVLDLGSGGGEVLAQLAAAFPGTRLTGVDPVADAHTAAARILPADRTHLVLSSTEEMERHLPDGERFDLILCHLNLALWDDPVQGLRAACRRLAPGGLVYVADLAAPDDAERAELLRLPRTESERTYLQQQLDCSLTTPAAEQLLREILADDPALQGHYGRGGLGGHPYAAPDALRLWQEPAVREAVQALSQDPGDAPSASAVHHWVIRRSDDAAG